MTAQIALREALRDIVSPAARAQGFKGSGNTWRRSNDAGDWAIVNVQSSTFSSRDRLRCVINLALAPRPWLDGRERRGGPLPKAISESFGLYRSRLHPTGSPDGVDTWWEITGPLDAEAAVADMAARLEVDGWPFLTRLLDRDELLRQIRSGDLGDIRGATAYLARAEAVMLSDDGPSDELERLLGISIGESMESQRENAREFADWVRDRAERQAAGTRPE